MRKILSVVTIIIFVLIAIYLIPNNSNGNSTKLIVPYKTVKALKGDLIIKISAKGIVEPNFKVEVKSKASGKVLTFPFEEGDYLKKGEALLHLNKNDETRSVAKANADLKSSEASLEISKTALLLQKNRYKTNLLFVVSFPFSIFPINTIYTFLKGFTIYIESNARILFID